MKVDILGTCPGLTCWHRLPHEARFCDARAEWDDVAIWKWNVKDDICGICQEPFDACAPNCKFPGDECPPCTCQCRRFESNAKRSPPHVARFQAGDSASTCSTCSAL